MAELTDLSKLLQSIGMKTPEELQAEAQARQMQQIQLQQQERQMGMSQQRNNLDVGQLSTGFGFPAYIAAQMKTGGNMGNMGGINIPGVPSQQPFGRTPGIMPGPTSSPYTPLQGDSTKTSDQLRQLLQQANDRGDVASAARIRMALSQAVIQEQEQGFKANEDARQQAELNRPVQAGTVGVDGKPSWRQQQDLVYDETTKKWGYRDQGPAYEVSSGDTNIDVGGLLTGPREEAAAKDFATQTEATLNFLHAAAPVYKLLGEGAASGWTGGAMTKIDNALATARTSLDLLVDDPAQVSKMVNADFANTSKWKTIAGKTQLSNSALVGLAYTLAASYNKDGRISDKDMEKALTELGGNLSDPQSARRVLRQAINRAKDRYKTSWRTTSPLMGDKMRPKVQAMFKDASGDFELFDQENQDTPQGPDAIAARIAELEKQLSIK